MWVPLDHTPIIIDTDGSGFHLTSATQGIKWDFFGDGRLFQIAWTEAGWLALDLNNNGTIDNARELFGNASQQVFDPKDPQPNLNGFNALAYWDNNHDGVIDRRDAVFAKLLIWIDSNHDGISQPKELHHLKEMGIQSISITYSDSPKVDKHGNQFRLQGTLNPDAGDDVNRTIYDVTLTTAK